MVTEKNSAILTARVPQSLKDLVDLASRASGASVAELVTLALHDQLPQLVQRQTAERQKAIKEFQAALNRQAASEKAPSLRKALAKAVAANQMALNEEHRPYAAGD